MHLHFYKAHFRNRWKMLRTWLYTESEQVVLNLTRKVTWAECKRAVWMSAGRFFHRDDGPTYKSAWCTCVYIWQRSRGQKISTGSWPKPPVTWLSWNWHKELSHVSWSRVNQKRQAKEDLEFHFVLDREPVQCISHVTWHAAFLIAWRLIQNLV